MKKENFAKLVAVVLIVTTIVGVCYTLLETKGIVMSIKDLRNDHGYGIEE